MTRSLRSAILMGTAIGSYAWMHVAFFGVPQFAPGTAAGRAEIAYALGTLCLVGMGTSAIVLERTK
jgi:hypothetical protein